MPAEMLKMMVLLLFIIFLGPLLLLPTFGVTIDEDLKLLNKPTVKTIIDNGDIYDCVDINKQPAFDHPSLKNHKIQLKPSSYPVGFDDDDDDISNSSASIQIGLPDGGCPSGTVPIRRLTKENLMRMNSSLKNMKIMSSPSMHNDTILEESHHQWAVYVTKRKKLSELYGASAFINVYSLPLTKERQFSSSKIWVVNGEDDDLTNIIAAGWMISKDDYGDIKTRLSAAWTNDNFEKTGCRDTSCPGFVQISKEFPLGLAIKPLSTYGGPQYGLNIIVFKDSSKHWWFFLKKTKILIGYWPNDIFTLLNSNANKLIFGGAVGYLNNPDRPPMGNGHFPVEAANKACFFSDVKYVGKENKIQDLNSKNVDPFSSSEECYYVGPYLDSGGVFGNYMFYFGGPGYC